MLRYLALLWDRLWGEWEVHCCHPLDDCAGCDDAGCSGCEGDGR